jgi:hypothetical protein
MQRTCAESAKLLSDVAQPPSAVPHQDLLHSLRVAWVVVIFIAALAGSARPAEPTDAERRANSAALSLMNRTGFLQIAASRQAVAEVPLEEATKVKVDDIFVRMESDLRPLIAAVQTDPDSLDANIRRGRQVVAKAQEEVRQLLTDEQFQALGRRTRIVQAQLMAVTAGPAAFREAKTALQLTPEQAKKLDQLLSETAAKSRKLTDALTNEERMVPSAEQLVTVATEARKKLREILTTEQLKQLDESTNTALVDRPSESRVRGH